MASGPVHGRGVGGARLLGPTGRAGACGRVRPGRAHRGRCRRGAGLARARQEPVVGPGDRPAPRRLRGSDRAHDRRLDERRSRGASTRPRWTSSSRALLPFEQVARYRDDPALEDRVFVHPSDAFWSRDDEPRRSAVRRRPRPPCGGSGDRQGGARSSCSREPPYGPFGFSWGEVATHMATDALEGRLLRAFDPYPYDPEAAREEMRASAYDRTGDGRCDAPACRNVRALVMDEGVHPRAGAGDPRGPGRGGDRARRSVELTSVGGRVLRHSIHDPREHIPMGIAYPWGQDYPGGRRLVLALFDRSGSGGSANTSLLGATPAELREVGVPGHLGPERRRPDPGVPRASRRGHGPSAGRSWIST